MKRTFTVFLAMSLLLMSLTGCGGGETLTDSTPRTAAGIAAAIAASQSELPGLYAVAFDSPEFAAYSMLYLGDSAGKCADGVICYPLGVTACEIAVFELDGAGTAEKCAETLTAYRDERVGAFFGYAPEEAELAESGLVLTRGRYAALVICHDNEAAQAAWDGCFGAGAGEALELYDYVSPMPTPDTVPGTTRDTVPDTTPDTTPDTAPEGPDVYDHDAVLAAFESGDTSGLTPKNLAVYDKCRQIIAGEIKDGMTPAEKELAINDYLVLNSRYDPAELTDGPVGVPDPDNDNPYGLLIHGVGICLGYAASFQLFMDILGIECLTVHGFAHSWSEEHAWNLVRLDGEWYAVDVTWNDPVFGDVDPPYSTQIAFAHTYFNVTSDYLRSTDHQWRENVPEAAGTRWAY